MTPSQQKKFIAILRNRRRGDAKPTALAALSKLHTSLGEAIAMGDEDLALVVLEGLPRLAQKAAKVPDEELPPDAPTEDARGGASRPRPGAFASAPRGTPPSPLPPVTARHVADQGPDLDELSRDYLKRRDMRSMSESQADGSAHRRDLAAAHQADRLARQTGGAR